MNYSSEDSAGASKGSETLIAGVNVRTFVVSLIKVICMAAGLPLNLRIIYRVLYAYAHRKTVTGFSKFKLHLAISDFMVLAIYTSSTTVWHLTESWHGGDFLCRSVSFLNSLSFYFSSNIMVCIALERLSTVMRVASGPRNAFNNPAARIHSMIVAAWMVGIASSSPQLFVWSSNVFFNNNTYCTTIWQTSLYKSCAPLFYENYTLYRVCSAQRIEPEQIYGIFHIATVFWIPACIISVSYTLMSVLLLRCAVRQANTLLRYRQQPNDPQQTTCSALAPLNSVESVDSIESPERQVRKKRSISISINRFRMTRKTSKPQHWTSVARSKTMRRTLLLTAAYVLFWLPYVVTSSCSVLVPKWYHGSFLMQYDYLSELLILNSVVNPLLYRTPGARNCAANVKTTRAEPEATATCVTRPEAVQASHSQRQVQPVFDLTPNSSAKSKRRNEAVSTTCV